MQFAQPTPSLDMTLRVFLLGASSALALLLGAVRGPAFAAEDTRPRPFDAGTNARLARAVSSTARIRASGDTVPLYTEEQLTNGTALYAKVCAECHEDGDYTNAKFRAKWNGKTLYDLYEEVRTKMPEDKPNTLTRDEYANALAYILKQNGVPAGPNRIAPDSAAMSAVTLNFGTP